MATSIIDRYGHLTLRRISIAVQEKTFYIKCFCITFQRNPTFVGFLFSAGEFFWGKKGRWGVYFTVESQWALWYNESVIFNPGGRCGKRRPMTGKKGEVQNDRRNGMERI